MKFSAECVGWVSVVVICVEVWKALFLSFSRSEVYYSVIVCGEI